ncbi:MAG: chemotaxis protein CheW [Ignavibacteriaceae bacterium]|nr:chemotaxis protein CheW [Ignavibacteriaceae bacterium]
MIDHHLIGESLTGLVVFEISEMEFCTDIKNVSAIINPNELNQPSLFDSHEPKIQINDLIIQIIDIHKFFGVEHKSNSKDKRIIIVENQDKTFGFFVERVKEIFSMSKGFKSKLKFSTSDENEFLLGKLNYEGRQLFIPDFSKIASDILK